MTALTYATAISEIKRRKPDLQLLVMSMIGMSVLSVWAKVFDDGIFALCCMTLFSIFSSQGKQFAIDAADVLQVSGLCNAAVSVTNVQVLQQIRSILWIGLNWWECKVSKRSNRRSHQLLVVLTLIVHLRKYMTAYVMDGADTFVPVLLAAACLLLRAF